MKQKIFYCYNRSNHELTNHSITNPNVKLVRNEFWTASNEYPDDNMRPEFFFDRGVIEARTDEEVEFLTALVNNQPYKLINGRMFEPWVSAVYFKWEKNYTPVKEEKKTEYVDKLVITSEVAGLMSIDWLKQFASKAWVKLPKETNTHEEIVTVLTAAWRII